MSTIKNKFTLIELVIVISIITILALIIVPNVQNILPSTTTARVTADAKNLQGAIDKYYFDNGIYPTIKSSSLEFGEIDNVSFDKLYPKYIKNIPRDADKFYYWVDWTGNVWIASVDAPKFKIENGVLKIEPVEGAQEYNVYELNKNTAGIQSYKLLGSTSSNNYFNLKLQGTTKTELGNEDGISENKSYFVSGIDSFDFETAPVHKGYTGGVKSYSSKLAPLVESSDALTPISTYPNMQSENLSYSAEFGQLSGNIFPSENISLGSTSSTKTYRMEVEDSRVLKSLHSSYNHSSLSNGQEARLYYTSNYIQYDFVGTGFDVIYKSYSGGTNMNVYVDGQLVGQKNTYSASTMYQQSFPIRNLTQGKHTITIKSTGGYVHVDAIDIYGEDTTPIISNAKLKAVVHHGQESISDNHVIVPNSTQDKVKAYYTLSNDGKTTVKITDSNSNVIRTLQNEINKNGGTNSTHSIVWDGKSDGGQMVSDGYYTMHIFSVGVDGDHNTETKLLINVDHNKPIYRMESEDSRVLKVVHSSYSHSSLSNSKESRIYYTSDYVQYDFEGTGVDVIYTAYSGGSNMKVLIDGKVAGRINTYSATTRYQQKFSIRDLTEGKHTVTIKTEGGYVFVDAVDIYHPNTAPSIQNLRSYTFVNENKSILGNNVLTLNNDTSNHKLNFEYELTYNGYTNASIVDNNNQHVRTIATDLYQLGGTKEYNTLSWDGKDDNGVYVESGKYKFVIQTSGIEGQVFAPLTHDITVDNYKPSYRMETDDSRVLKVLHSSYNHSSLSNNNESRLYYTSDYIQYTFTGTGLDIVYKPYSGGANMKVLVDGVEVGRVSTYSATTRYQQKFSIRDLNHDTHTVTIKSEGGYVHVDALDIFTPDTKPVIKNMKSVVMTHYNESYSENNIITLDDNMQSKLYYTVNIDSKVSINILDSNGNIVRNLQDNVFKTGGTNQNHYIVWDGKDSNGNYVSNGKYQYQISAISVRNYNSDVYTYDVYMDQSSPNYRVEIESSEVLKSIHSSYNHSSLSNNQEIRLYYTSNYAQHTFTGTGFDIVYKPYSGGTNMKVLVDGVEVGRISTYSASTRYQQKFSIRNLSSGSHTVTIKSEGGYVHLDAIDIYN